MSVDPKLHARLEALEKRLAKARSELDTASPEKRAGLGALLESISEQIDELESQHKT